MNDEIKIGVVVLGQSLNADGSAPSTLISRVETLVGWVDQRVKAGETPAFPIVVSGGDPVRSGVPESRTMREMVLRERPHWEAALIEEPLSNNTVQNAWFSLPLLAERGAGHVFVLTSEFHAPRSRYIFETVMALPGRSMFSSLSMIAAPTPPPDPSQMTSMINKMTMKQRIELEIHLVQHNTFQKRHIEGIDIAPPPQAKLDQALSDLQLLL